MPRSSPAPAVVFDMDGLLLDTERLSRAAWLAAGDDLGVALPLPLLQHVIGRRRAEVEREFRLALGPDLDIAALYERHGIHYRARLDAVPPGELTKPGVLPLLEWLAERQVPHAIATSTLAAGAADKLARAGLADRFAVVVTGEQVPRSKPAPDIYLEAAARLGVPASACVGFEDSDVGLAAVIAAGMRAVAVPDLKPLPAEVRASAWAVIDSLHDAIPLLESVVQVWEG